MDRELAINVTEAESKDTATASTGWLVRVKEAAKVGVALVGLVAGVGIIGYFFKGLFRGTPSTTTAQATVEVLDDNSGTSLANTTASSVVPLEAREASTLLQPTNLESTAAATPVVASTVATTTEEEELGEENAFSTDDVRYRVSSLGSSNQAECSFVAEVDLSQSINNGWGTQLVGGSNSDSSGTVVQFVTGFSGAGVKSILITSPGALSGTGSSFLVTIPPDSWPLSIDFNIASTSQVFRFNGNSGGSGAASAVGDVNGDNYTDLAFGSSGATVNGLRYAGKTNIVYGLSDLLPNPFDLDTVNGTTGFIVNGKSASGLSGYAVSAAGNFGSHQIKGVVIGTPLDGLFAGVTTIVYGATNPRSMQLNLSSSDSVHLFNVNGQSVGESSGSAVAGGFDFNHDGQDDVATGATQSGGVGAVYVAFGRNTTGVSSISVATLNDGIRGMKIVGEQSGDQCGSFVRFVKSINIDSIPDLLIGAPYANGNSGKLYGVYGNTTLPGVLNLANIQAANGFVVIGKAGDKLGFSAGVGDFLGSGRVGLMVGAPGAYNNDGAVYYIVPKGNATWPTVISLASPPSNVEIIKLHGAANSQAGYSVDTDDLNGDGASEIIVGSPSGMGGYGISNLIFGGCNSSPIAIVNNTLSIYQGATLVIDNTNLALANPALGISFVVINSQHGYFSMVKQGVSISTFTVEQVTKRSIQYTHDNSHYPPSYELAVNNGLIQGQPAAATVAFAAEPELLANQFIVNQNQMVTVTNATLSANAFGSNPRDLTFIIQNMQNGAFIVKPSMTSVANFTQSLIFDALLNFQAANSQVKPSFDIYITDGTSRVGPISAQVVYDALPTANRLGFTLGQDRVNPITSAMLSFDHVGFDSGELQIIIKNATNSQFVFNGYAPITSFLQKYVATNNISVITSGVVSPIITIQATDGSVTTQELAVPVDYILCPILLNNKLLIGEGQTIPVDNTMLSVYNPNLGSGSASIIYTLSNQNNCFFDSVLDPGTPITTFTEGDKASGLIRLTATGSPSFTVRVSDSRGIAVSAPSNATITYIQAPVITKNTLVIGQGQEEVLSLEMLNATDARTNAANLICSVSNIVNCQFILTSDATRAITSFTLEQVANGVVKVMHDSTQASPPAYTVSVSNGIVATTASATIDFHNAPKVLASSLALYQGQTKAVDNKTLSIVTNENPSVVQFIMSNLQHVRFALSLAPSVDIYNFSWQQLRGMEVLVAHDSSKIAPVCYFKILTPYITDVLAVPMSVSFDLKPVLVSNSLNIYRNQKAKITSNFLSATDVDSSVQQLRFNFANVTGGFFVHGDATDFSKAIFAASQAEVMDGNLSFIARGDLPPYYLVSVSDGIASSAWQPATSSFIADESQGSTSYMWYGITGGVAAGVFIFKFIVGRRINNLFASNELADRVCRTLVDYVSFSGFVGMGQNTAVRLRKQVDALLKKLTKEAHIDLNLSELTPDEQQILINAIASGIESILIPQATCCSSGVRKTVKKFFCAESTSELFALHVDRIATAVQVEVKTAQQNIRIKRATDKKHNAQAHPLMMSSSSSSVDGSATVELAEVSTQLGQEMGIHHVAV